MDFRVFKSEDGEILVQSKFDDFVASYKQGEWFNEMMFDPSEMLILPVVESPSEAKEIVREAKKALSRW